MTRHTAIRLGACLLLALSGCSSGYSKHEAVEKETLQVTNELADVLESVKDRESAKAAASKIETICDRIEKLKKKADGLPKISTADEEKLQQALKPDREKTAKRMNSASFQANIKSETEPSFVKAAQRMALALKSLQNR